MTELVTIKSKAPSPGLASTFQDDVVCAADGKPIPGVRSVEIHLAEGCVNTAEIEVLPESIEVDAVGCLWCRHDGEDYVLVPRDHWERVQKRLYELRGGDDG